MPRMPVIHILQKYFSEFMMLFSTKMYIIRWVLLEIGIDARFLFFLPSLFILAMQILLKAAGSNIPEAHFGKGFTCLQQRHSWVTVT